jgi:ribonuclease J
MCASPFQSAQHFASQATPGLQLTIHRSVHEIGGNCIELALTTGSRLLLDAGRPLDAPEGTTGLLPATLDRSRPVDGVLISHPHQDHYGLLGELPPSWPVWCGEASARLMSLTDRVLGRRREGPLPRVWRKGEKVQVGAFHVTPLLTDHSAFDAHMLLIEAAGHRLLYTGDFRRHGRKSALVQRTIDQWAGRVDLLLMEGTNLGSDKPTSSETELEAQALQVMQRTSGRVFVSWSAQNIDRTVSLYRACLRTGRTLVVDLYTADVLETLADQGRLPRPGWAQLQVVITRRLARLYRRQGREDFVARMARHGIAARALASAPQRWVVMLRSSLAQDFSAAGVVPDPSDAWLWSMWHGYLREAHAQALVQWMAPAGVRPLHLHTSGHASADDLRDFACRIGARRLVPVHGQNWDEFTGTFNNLTRLRDGEVCLL